MRTSRLAIVTFATAAVMAATLVAAAGSPQKPPRNASLLIASAYGADLYDFYCASCHGVDGKGHGPTAPALTTAPSDLSTLTARNGGEYPRQRVEDYVTGKRAATAHGSAAMPVWGPIFKSLDANAAANAVRIGNIVEHIKLLQSRP